MLFYLIANAPNDVGLDLKRVPLLYIPYYGDGIVPVHTSLQSCSPFVRRCNGEEESRQFVGLGKDPFQLAEMVESLKAFGGKSLYFDPLPAPDGEIWTWGEPIPMDDYRSLIAGIRPEFEKLGEEAVTRFKQPSHLRDEPFVRWRNQQVEEIVADILCWIEEWTAINGS